MLVGLEDAALIGNQCSDDARLIKTPVTRFALAQSVFGAFAFTDVPNCEDNARARTVDIQRGTGPGDVDGRSVFVKEKILAVMEYLTIDPGMSLRAFGTREDPAIRLVVVQQIVQTLTEELSGGESEGTLRFRIHERHETFDVEHKNRIRALLRDALGQQKLILERLSGAFTFGDIPGGAEKSDRPTRFAEDYVSQAIIARGLLRLGLPYGAVLAEEPSMAFGAHRLNHHLCDERAVVGMNFLQEYLPGTVGFP